MVSETRVDDDTKGIYSHRLCGCWLVGGSSNLGGWLLRSNFTNDEVAALTEAMEATTTTANEIPEYFPGVLLGFGLTVEEATAALTPRPDDAIDFLRAILTSIANVEARSYAELYKLGASHEVRRVFTAGGGAKNEKWSTIRSDALGGVPVTASPYAEAAYGSALLARMGHYELASYVPDMCADPTAVCEVR
jgi:sugar (pentulose or hexulose) kinase